MQSQSSTAIVCATLSLSALLLPVTGGAATKNPSLIDGDYALTCETTSLVVHGTVTGSLGIVPILRAIPLTCPDKASPDASPVAIAEKLANNIAQACNSVKFLSSNINCEAEANRVTNVVQRINDAVISFIPDQIAIQANNPSGLSWLFNLGTIQGVHEWTDNYGNIENRDISNYLFTSINGAFIGGEIARKEINGPIGSCYQVGTSSVVGQIYTKNFDDMNLQTRDLDMKFINDITIRCSTKIGQEWITTNIGLGLTGELSGQRK